MADKKEVSKQVPLLAIIRIRGDVNVNTKIKDTLKMLHLHKKNRCTIVPATESFKGMITKVKDYCTFGEIDEATLLELLTKRGRIVGNKPLTDDFLKRAKKGDIKSLANALMTGVAIAEFEGVKPFFKLHPPRGGFEREGIKKPYSMNGSLGYRREKINKLLKRMV